MKRHRARLFRIPRLLAALLLPVILVVFVMTAFDTARACWQTILIECFDRPSTQWPWNPPGDGQWMVSPTGSPHWGIHVGNYFDILMCPDDDQSLWCYGYPVGNDPEFDVYPSSYNTYVMFGPINLSQVHAAQVLWSMWSRTEELHDSVFWGASTQTNLTDQAMKIGGREWQETNDWERYSMDLDSLHDFLTGQDVSMIGLGTVYVFWRFRSDPNGTRDIGTFIDNVSISVDDSLQNVMVGGLEILRPDSDAVPSNPQVGDSLMANFQWSICAGAVEEYAPFRIMATLNSTVIFDTLIADGHAGEFGQVYTPLWEVEQAGDYVVRVVADTFNAIPENNETDNVAIQNYHVDPPNYPPEFYWITPGTDTLDGDTTVTLRWFASDPEEVANIAIYHDNEPQGCIGVAVPGGNRPEIGGEDSLLWDVHFLPNRIYYLYARVTDSANDTCIYAPWPMYVCHGCTPANEQPIGIVPETYYVEQNYPNPFNPVTEIRYGVAVPGDVRLVVFDVLGRNVATLASGYRDRGSYVVCFDGTGLTSGLYMYVLTSPEGSIGRKMMLLK